MAETAHRYEFEALYIPETLTGNDLRELSRELGAVVVGGDGIVPGAPSCDISEPVYILDHHFGDKQTRLEMPATCEQTYQLIRSPHFQQQATRIGRVVFAINGQDGDTAESSRLFGLDATGWHQNAPRWQRRRSRWLTRTEDMADRTSGRSILELDQVKADQFEHIHDAPMRARLAGVNQASIDASQAIFNARGQLFVEGRPETSPRNEAYELLGTAGEWAVIAEEGPFAVLGAMRHYRNIVSERTDAEGRRHIALHSYDGLLSHMVLQVLQQHELTLQPALPELENWGGCGMTGGSPRKYGTLQNPIEVASHIHALTAAHEVHSQAA